MSTNLAIMFSPRETIFVEIQVYVAMVTLKMSDTIDILIALWGYRSKPSAEAAPLKDLDIHLEKIEDILQISVAMKLIM